MTSLGVPHLFEGDIVPNRVVDEASSSSGTSKRDAQRFRNYLWRTRVIPYTISSEFGMSTDIILCY